MSYSVDGLKRILHHSGKWIKEQIKLLNIQPIEKKHGFYFYDDSIVDILSNIKIKKEKTLSDYAQEFGIKRNSFYGILKRLNIDISNIEEHLEEIKTYISFSTSEKLFLNRDSKRKTKRNLAKELNLTYAQMTDYCYKHNLSVEEAYSKKEEISSWYSLSKKERYNSYFKNEISFKYYADKLQVNDYLFRAYCSRQNIKLEDIQKGGKKDATL